MSKFDKFKFSKLKAVFSNRTKFSINEINDDHMIHIAPNYESGNPKATETFAYGEAFSFWFENLAKRHSNWNMTNTHASQATRTVSPKDVVTTVYFVCDHQGLPKKVKLVEDTGNQKAKRVQTRSIKNSCKAKITKKTLQNASLGISSFPMSLCINAHLNKLSRKNAIDKASVKQWIEFLEKKKELSGSHCLSSRFLSWQMSDALTPLTRLANPWCIPRSTRIYLITTLSQWLSWVKSNCSLRVKRVMIDCSPVEIGALEEVFGQLVQVLLCYWHIKRAWEMYIKKDINYVKITGATHESKCEQDAVWVTLNLLIHAKTKEAFDQQYEEFVSKFAGHEKCVAYFATHWHAKFHTNNLIESYHHILKAYYLGRSKNFWVDRLVYMLSQVVEYDYKQEGLKIMYGFKKLVLTHVEKAKKKKAFDVDHEDALCMIKTVEDNLMYKCCSFTDNSVWYEVLLKEKNPEVQVVKRNEESAAAQNELHLLELDEVSESRKLEEWFWDRRNIPDFERLLVSDRRNRRCFSAKV
ncbi:hypothetical protein PHYBLDRAFT_161848 [Phycomyces blakesleeanus NRRL 1555(-)]|uniref:MULE transposase domain-containing protein n=1 Tax=Phycomyces blakesleeanus (strain ATCC 8743b / DSM 1359 / FGSC 10004 / NBRC 33097 / NRRL 1555) TaxID=763407 RepID=A0A162YK29_PHYB8|nr:hypothetical protein PHYBLDRAFT_161848 [Phycomyces blakesleeanus NRRL 1555(-)]OAD81225.1 hypothetical protein PHYBLDRAFT_161848 [Phycomyces blakesleeanus NRRL 1555(-)]|eukprot:XP_018299265.1 hypothetical protein PHYBLDRAFT_161848 [Phycomyces blakesleeanus NRRL 1555(-)]